MVNSLRFTKSDKVDLSTAVNHRKRLKFLLVISFIWFTFCVVDRLLVNANRNRKMRPSSGSKSSPVNRFPKVNLQVEEIKTYDVRAVEFQMSRFHLGRNDIVKNLKKKNTKWIFDQLLVDDICIFWSFETRSCYVVSLAASRVSMFTLVQQKQMKT